MRYRKLDADGDYVFGRQQNDFYQDTPEAVGQAVLTRLRLLRAEWFANTAAGMPWLTEVIGKNTSATYDGAIRQQILQTSGVQGITAYESKVDSTTRKLSITTTIDTIYGSTQIQATL